MTPPMFSVIVPTYRRPDRLLTCLDAIARLDYPRERFEVIVVDDGSPAAPHGVVDTFRGRLNITLLVEAHRGVSAARNAGARVARGYYLAFTADDCTPEPGWLRAFADGFARVGGHTALGGAIHNGCSDNSCAEASHLLIDYLCHSGRGASSNGFYTPNNLAVPAAAFRTMCGFDPAYALSTGEDRDFCARWQEHGFHLESCPNASVVHYHPLSLLSFLRMHWRYGRGSGQFWRRRAHRLGNRFPGEPLPFYLRLVSHPVRSRGLRAIPLSMLLLMAQIVNATGVLTEWSALFREKTSLDGNV